MDALRGEKGCPWDKEQTLDSLKPFLIEETYEVIEAIEQDDPEKLKEELGDLLFHIVFMSKVCSDIRRFGISDVIDFAHEKMTRRHAHVFGQRDRKDTSEKKPSAQGPATAASLEERASQNQRKPTGEKVHDATISVPPPNSPQEVLDQWYRMKQEEMVRKGSTSLMDGIPRHLPALQKAQKTQRRASQVGFDWEKAQDVVEKISEETQELREAISRREKGHIAEEMGDILFSVVNVCRLLKLDAEQALRRTTAKFAKRFREMERRVAASGKKLGKLSISEMDAVWDAIKAEEEQQLQQGR
jgi:tetrapyrrole methylase family protein/MazG family protein